MASKYFFAANFWLLLSVVVYAGKATVRTQPAFYALFGVGKSFDPITYSIFNLALLAVSVVYFVLFIVMR